MSEYPERRELTWTTGAILLLFLLATQINGCINTKRMADSLQGIHQEMRVNQRANK